ncbi:hypothetical protein Bca4012_041313 [Brassica carinata]
MTLISRIMHGNLADTIGSTSGGKSGGGGGKSSGGGYMVAPGSKGGAYISRGGFERNPQGYFSNLHGSGQSKK